MKKLLLFLFIFSNSLIAIGQNEKLFKKVQKNMNSIRSGKYSLTKTYSYSDATLPKKELYGIEFSLYNKTTICLVNDILKNELVIFDTSIWVSVYNYNDSTLKKQLRYNPNFELLYAYLQPKAFIIYPSYFKKPYTTETKNNIVVTDTFNNYSFLNLKNKFEYFEIDKNTFFIKKYSHFKELSTDDDPITIEFAEEEVSEIKTNHLLPNLFLLKIAETVRQLPIKKTVFIDYENIQQSTVK